jgi:hypothetical protein
LRKYLSAVVACDGTYDEQAEASTFHARAATLPDTVEAFEDALEFLLRNTDAAIAHAKDEALFVRLG